MELSLCYVMDCGLCVCRVEDYNDIQNPPVTLMDGTPLHSFIMETKKRTIDTTHGASRSYRGLEESKYNRTLTDKYSLVLFHFVTRSLEDYTSRKINMVSGKYKARYVQHYGKERHLDLNDPAVMAEFEHGNDFDGIDPVCSSAQTAQYATRCCDGDI